VNVLVRTLLTYGVASGGTTHAPLALVSVGGLPAARFVLDTGSDVHLFNEDLADELGLDKEPGEEGTDHSGATMPSWTVGDVQATLDGLAVSLREVVAIPAPPPFPGFGIRGILSPHILHPTAYAVIDTAAGELLLVDGSDAEVADFLRARSPDMELVELRRETGQQVVVRAAIEGFAEVRALIDTGGKKTEFAMAAVPGLLAGKSERLGGGVSGAEYHGGFVGPQTLVIGGARLTVPDLAVRDQVHDVDGIISMDVLRGTVVAAAADVERPAFLLLR
jgi:hypothetical protein